MQRRKPRGPLFSASLQSDGTLELLVYEDIGEDWLMGGGITAKTIKAQMDFAGNFSKVLIRINSPGGDAFEGNAIYNLLRAQHVPIEVCIDGIAASSASIIAMAGDSIVMAPNAMMMIHNAWGQCVGYASDMRKTADVLDKVSGSISLAYVTRTGLSDEEITKMMDAETWMTAQECLDIGFCTDITPDPETGTEAIAMARRFRALRRMKHVPAALARSTECECDCDNCLDSMCSECDNADCEDRNCKDCPMQEPTPSAPAPPVLLETARARLDDIESEMADDAVPVESARQRVDSIESVLRAVMD